jgi:trehalose 6-phosphate phosphatase
LLLRGGAEATVDPEAERWAGRVRGVADGVRADRLRAAGLLREDKGPIVALHWRGADDEHRAEALAREIAASAVEAGLVIHEGRRVLELRPPIPIGKDAAIRRLLATAPVSVALYVGDDRTDVDAFAGLRALVDRGSLDAAACIGVRSEETPDELVEAADALVDGIDGVRALLGALVR